jgi:hypothetical protein
VAFREREGFKVRDIDKQEIRRVRLFPGLNTKDIWHIIIKIPSIACKYHYNSVTTRYPVLLENCTGTDPIVKINCIDVIILLLY